MRHGKTWRVKQSFSQLAELSGFKRPVTNFILEFTSVRNREVKAQLVILLFT